MKDDLVAEWAANNAPEDNQTLDLTVCPEITDGALLSLQQEFKKKQLRALKLDAPGYESTKLTGNAILNCVAHFDELRLGSVIGTGQSGVQGMLEKWLESDPFVERLDLSSGEQLPADFVMRLATDLSSLRRGGLHVSEWPAQSFGEISDGVFVPSKDISPGVLHRVACVTTDGIITLRFNEWPDPTGVGIAGAITACAATVERVEAAKCSLSAAGAQSVASVLQFNRALKSANLGGNGIGDEGTAALSDALKTNSTLETLELLVNKIGAAGAQSLAGMLQFNRALMSVILDQNSIGDRGAAALSEALKSNSTLANLELRNNKIGSAGAQSLAEMLQVNRALNSVDLRFNQIPDEGKQQLRDAAKGKNTTLQL